MGGVGGGGSGGGGGGGVDDQTPLTPSESTLDITQTKGR